MGRRGARGALIRRGGSPLPLPARLVLLLLVLAAAALAAWLGDRSLRRAFRDEMAVPSFAALVVLEQLALAAGLLAGLRLVDSNLRRRSVAFASLGVGLLLLATPWIAYGGAPSFMLVFEAIREAPVFGASFVAAGLWALLRLRRPRGRSSGPLTPVLAVACLVCFGIFLDRLVGRLLANRAGPSLPTVRIAIASALLALGLVLVARTVALASRPPRSAAILALLLGATALGGFVVSALATDDLREWAARLDDVLHWRGTLWIPAFLFVAGIAGLWRSFRPADRAQGDPDLDHGGIPG